MDHPYITYHAEDAEMIPSFQGVSSLEETNGWINDCDWGLLRLTW